MIAPSVELPGLRAAKAIVDRIACGDVAAHAILLYGPAGIGKTTLARALTKAWLRRLPDGEDGSVNAFRRGASADVVEVRPVGPSNLIRLGSISPNADKDDDLGVDLQTFFRTKPLTAAHKVAIVHDCHRMNSRAANAFLKTLEEPHPHVRIVMTTSEIGSVLATIRSRCLCVACEAPSEAELLAAIPDATADERRFSEDAPATLMKVRASRDVYDRLARFARGLASKTSADALVVSEEFRAICDAFAKAEGANPRGAQTATIEALAVFLARDPEVEPAWIQELTAAHRRVQGNVNAALVFDATFARMLAR